VVNDSCIDVHIKPGKAGESAFVTVEPPGSGAAVDGVIQTVAERARHSYSIERIVAAGPGASVRLRVAGRFWSGAGEAVECRTVASPAMYFGSVLAEALRGEGLTVAGPVARERLADAAGRARPDFECDVIHTSRLDTTVGVANKNSQGLYAECLMKLLGAYGPAARSGEAAPAAGAVLPPRQGTWAGGTEEARLWLSERGIPAEGCVIDDGSGLSKENRLTALVVTELLRVMFERHGDGFIQTLAAAGQEGSLAKRLRGTAAEGRVWGKTGYVLGTSALSGYVRAKSGRMIIFSILMNDVPWGELWKARLAQDKVCLRLVEY
jgi:D-alanyl-D-alanine carboxypeptidase/D-alanyl-D-alanine-endopeptidase (penicillin-binding protein 4)